MNTALSSGVFRWVRASVVGLLAALPGPATFPTLAWGDSIPTFSERFEKVMSWRGPGFEITVSSPSSSSRSSFQTGTNTFTDSWTFTPIWSSNPGWSTASSSASTWSGSRSSGSLPQSGVSSTTHTPHAFINMGMGPYPFAESLTTGNARPWYESSVVQRLFGSMPGANQIRAFSELVLQRVQDAYERSGVPNLRLTLDPDAGAPRTLSVVSHTRYGPIPQAAGVALSGFSGFSFIDAFSDARNVDELGWLVAHNIAHELMHTFGVDHHDTTGNFLDSGVTNWSTMLDPQATFSASAVADLNSRDFNQVGHATRFSLANGQQIGDTGDVSWSCRHCQMLAFAQQLGGPDVFPAAEVAPVSEPASVMGWGMLISFAAWVVRRRSA